IQGSIANELYSEIVQSSNVELDRGLTAAAQANDNLHGKESDSGDVWYEEGNDDYETSDEHSVEKMNKRSDMEREWQRRHNQFHTIGYRDGLIAGKEAAAQKGFNIGFENSVFAGYNWGLVRGINSAMACLPGGLKEKLVETEETRNKFNHLHETVQSLSTTDALKLFYENQKRKLPNENESGVLENYHRQLESLVNESPLLEGHLKAN
ncbi:yae1 domain-containing protein 1, partial [Phtheirospermum japonicum]